MKSCPTCNRTFEDTFTFCLVDGSILSPPYDPKATLVLPQSQNRESAPTKIPPPSNPQGRGNNAETLRDIKHEQRLPIYLLIDCSRSMEGSPQQAMEEGVKALLSDLRNNPQTLETVWVSLITFARDAWPIVPLTPISSFDPPKLFTDVQDETALSAALLVLNRAINREVVSKTESHRGDFCPLVIVFIDGEPTDEWQTAVKFLMERRNPKLGGLMLLTAGPAVDPRKLQAAVPELLVSSMRDITPETFHSLLKWVDQS
jgi:uncharacterized protein YegL